ncbi:MAG: flagellar export protein FliJ [Desulfovibrionaceae bacterium]
MGFSFKMQRVLEYREQLEEEAKVQLARIQQLLVNEQQRAENIRTLLSEQEHALYTSPLNDQGQRWLLEHFIKGLRTDLSSTLLRIRTLQQSFEEARRHVQYRAKERKILEKLKSRQHEQYALEERLKEQRTYDETATLRYKATAF